MRPKNYTTKFLYSWTSTTTRSYEAPHTHCILFASFFFTIFYRRCWVRFHRTVPLLWLILGIQAMKRQYCLLTMLHYLCRVQGHNWSAKLHPNNYPPSHALWAEHRESAQSFKRTTKLKEFIREHEKRGHMVIRRSKETEKKGQSYDWVQSLKLKKNQKSKIKNEINDKKANWCLIKRVHLESRN